MPYIIVSYANRKQETLSGWRAGSDEGGFGGKAALELLREFPAAVCKQVSVAQWIGRSAADSEVLGSRPGRVKKFFFPKHGQVGRNECHTTLGCLGKREMGDFNSDISVICVIPDFGQKC